MYNTFSGIWNICHTVVCPGSGTNIPPAPHRNELDIVISSNAKTDCQKTI